MGPQPQGALRMSMLSNVLTPHVRSPTGWNAGARAERPQVPCLLVRATLPRAAARAGMLREHRERLEVVGMRPFLLVVSAAAVLGACATPEKRTAIGAGGGAAVGAGIGALAGGGAGGAVRALVGGLAGGAVGHYLH